MYGRILRLERTSVAEYMGISQAIQESVAKGYGPTVFISNGWKKKGLSIGKKQGAHHINLEACKTDGLEVVRRPTEGYAAVHNPDDIAYGIAMPGNLVGGTRYAKRTFDQAWVFPAVARGLEVVGISGAYDPLPTRYGNVFVNGRKISGSAQNTDDRDAWLQHGIIAVRRHIAGDYVRYVRNGETDLAKIASRMISIEEERGFVGNSGIVDALDFEFSILAEKHGIKLVAAPLSSEETERSMELTRSKYEDEEWLLFGSGWQDKSERAACFVGWS